MAEYKLSPKAGPEAQRTMVFILLGGILVAAALGLWSGSGSVAGVLAGAVPLLLILGIGAVIGNRKGQRVRASYRLLVDDEAITRIQEGYPETSIRYGEISEVREVAGRGLYLQAANPARRIDVPSSLENYADFRQQLAHRHAIEPLPKGQERRTIALSILVWVVVLTALVLFLGSRDRYVVAGSGVLLILGALAGLVITQRSILTPKWVKWSSWLILFPIGSIALRVLEAIGGG